MQAFKIAIVPVTPFEQNCAILVCAKTNKAAVIDPGGDMERIEDAIKQTGADVEKIIITHGHIDHIGAVTPLSRKLNLPVEGPHHGDKILLESVNEVARRYGLPDVEPVTTGRWLNEGDKVTVGELEFDVFHCPGHSPGSVVFVWCPKEGQEGPKFAIVGDVLFQGSVGRTDLPGGSHQQLIDSIKTKLMTLPDETAFICGHGPTSTIGRERRTNPFIND
jgi:glyoxylase-like metal-dependent hydrolase (beta-lactamase superfamily II)